MNKCRLCLKEISHEEDRPQAITLPGGLLYCDMWGATFEDEYCQDCQDEMADIAMNG